jgi:hypothetical protein
MILKYGDAVVLVQKSPDGKTISRVNAIVLRSVMQPPNVARSRALKDHKGQLPAGEYVDLVYPRESPFEPKTNNLDAIFQFAHMVGQWEDGKWIGWEPILDKDDFDSFVDRAAKASSELKQQLAEEREAHAKTQALLETASANQGS